MSIEAITWAKAQLIPSSPQKLLLFLLAERIDNETGECFPGQQLLGQEASMCERQVRQHLKKLEDAGFIERRSRFRPDGRPTSDCYCFPGFLEWLKGSRDSACRSSTTGGNPPAAEIHRRRVSVSTTGGNPPPNRKKNPQKESLARPADGATYSALEIGEDGKAENPELDGFEAFWQAYPKKAGKAEAIKLWGRMDAVDRKAATDGIKPYMDSKKARDGFVQQGDTYLKKRTWQDFPPAELAGDPEAMRWERRLKLYEGNRLWPQHRWGPAPGQPGCEVPQALVDRHLRRLKQRKAK
jgi:hypothetical protein